MAKVKVNFESAKRLSIMDKQSVDDIGQSTVSEMRRLIANGISPVRGEKRFERYSEQKGGTYPTSVRSRFPDKKTRPVNLFLNGWYLNHLTYWVNEKLNYIGIGFSGQHKVKQPVPKKVQDFFEAHNEGMHPDVPQRKHLPNADGDEFAVSVQRIYLKRFAEAVDRAVKLMNLDNKKRP